MTSGAWSSRTSVRTRSTTALLWVICWRCGRTPVGLAEMGHLTTFAVNGNWPEDVRVTNWEVDDYGPYVESEKVEASGRDD
jgi:hypothetical protein